MRNFRAYANSIFWLSNRYEDIQYRNLGYYHEIQTQLAYLLKSIAFDMSPNPDIKYSGLIIHILIDIHALRDGLTRIRTERKEKNAATTSK